MPFAQAHCIPLLESKLKELQVFQRSLPRHAHTRTHASRHATPPPPPQLIRAQDHNTFTRNDAGPGLSSAGAAPTTLVTLGLTHHPASSPSCAGGEAAGTTQAAEGAHSAKKAKKAPAKKAAAAGPVTVTPNQVTITLPKAPAP